MTTSKVTKAKLNHETSVESKPSAHQKKQPAQRADQERLRRLYLPVYKLFRIKRVRHPVQLPSVWQLSKKTALTLWYYRTTFLWIGLIYTVANIVLVRGSNGGTDVSNLKNQVSYGLHGSAGQLAAGTVAFTGLLASSGNGNNTTAGVYQLVLGLIVSLATIWALRRATAKEKIGLKDPFYKGMFPLVPFILTIFVILLQSVPFLAGYGLYSTVITDGIAVGGVEKAAWGGIYAVLTMISVYLLCSSLFALYIVTLPDMTPMRALRSARKLVNYRRITVFRKLVFLPFALLIIAAIVMTPFIVFLPNQAVWVFFGVGMLSLILAHSYLYTLYKELLV